MRFFESAHIKDVLAFLRFVHNPQDELAWKRVVKLFHGIGGAGAERSGRRRCAGRIPLPP